MGSYDRESKRLRKAFETRVCATFADAFRCEVIREHASGILIARWLEGKLTFRKLWRLVGDHPGDYEAQLKAVSKKAKAALANQEKAARKAVSAAKAAQDNGETDGIKCTGQSPGTSSEAS